MPPPRCRDTAERHALLERAFALGVPRDYGHVRQLRLQREPSRLVPIGADIHGREQWLQPRAARALARMRAAATRDGVELQIVSAFRSIEYQLGIVERKLAHGQSIDTILRVSAAPGYSEHHTGRCVDLTTPGFAPLEEEFERSSAFAWLTRQATRFGFALSYPRGNRHDIAYEPWHWCWHTRSSSSQASMTRDGLYSDSMTPLERTVRTPSRQNPRTSGDSMFDHIAFGVSDYAASKVFFLKALASIGMALVSEGALGIELSADGKSSLCLYPTEEKPAHLHLAFKADNRQQVEAFHRAALEAGGKDHGGPGLRPNYSGRYYAAFVIGPDGHNIEVVFHEPGE